MKLKNLLTGEHFVLDGVDLVKVSKPDYIRAEREDGKSFFLNKELNVQRKKVRIKNLRHGQRFRFDKNSPIIYQAYYFEPLKEMIYFCLEAKEYGIYRFEIRQFTDDEVYLEYQNGSR